jgi:hypothetical protein
MLSVPGCVIVDDQKEADKDDDGASDSETTWGDEAVDSGDAVVDETEGPVSVTVAWGTDGVSLEVRDGGAWRLGMAETGGSCGEAVPCWTGEDCFAGFESGDGEAYGPWCHVVDGGEVSLDYEGRMGAFEEGSTVFQPEFADTVTYLLLPDGADRSGGACYVFGDRPAYYSDLGCVVLPL